MARSVARLTCSPRFWIVVVFFSLPLAAAPFLGAAGGRDEVLMTAADGPLHFDGDWQAAAADATTDGTIIVHKVTYPRTTSQTFTFWGDVSGTIGAGGDLVQGGLPAPALYTATEQSQPGWEITSIQCDDLNSPTSHGWTHVAYFYLDPGETVQCSFFNQQEGSAPCIDVVGRWPYGPAYVLDVEGSVAYLGSGAGLLTLDVSNPADPTRLGAVGLPAVVRGVDESGGHTYVTVSVGYDGSLQVLDTSDPTEPQPLGSYLLDDPGAVEVRGNLAYVAVGWGLLVLDVSNPANPTPAGWRTLPGWPRDVTVRGDHSYVAAGSYFHVVDVSNPANPQLEASLSTSQATGVDASGDLVYLATANTLRVIDVSDPAFPAWSGFVDTGGPCLDVTVVGELAYVADGGYGVTVVDVSVPGAPSVLGHSFSNDTQSAVVAGSYAYLAARYRDLRVVDVTLPSDPQNVGSYEVPDPAADVAATGSYLYVGLGYMGTLLVIDVSDPSAPVDAAVVSAYGSAEAVAVQGDLAVVSGDDNSTRVLDISNPLAPALLGTVVTPGMGERVAIHGDVAYVADGYGGLQIIDMSNPQLPVVTGVWVTGWSIHDVATDGDYAYLAADGDGLQVIDVRIPSSPVLVGASDPPGHYARAVAVRGDMVAIADSAGLRVIDVSDPADPVEIGRYLTQASASDVALSNGGGRFAYLALDYLGVATIDLADPAVPILVRTDQRASDVELVFAHGGQVYVGGREFELELLAPCGLIFADDLESGDLSAWSAAQSPG